MFRVLIIDWSKMLRIHPNFRVFLLILMPKLILAQISNSSSTVPIAYIAVNWTIARESLDSVAKESSLFPVQYVPLSPCSCDSSVDSCDVSCCCDTDCGQDTLNDVFGCDQEKEPIPNTSPRCQYKLPDLLERHPFFAFLCWDFHTTAHLGMFYRSVPGVLRAQSGEDVQYKQHVQSDNSPAAITALHGLVEPLSSGETYVSGSMLQSSFGVDRTGPLTLPAPIFNDRCADSNPVRFLEPSMHRCVTELNDRTCVKKTRLSARAYLTPKLGDNEIDSPSRVRSVLFAGSGQDKVRLAESLINVKYVRASSISPPRAPVSLDQTGTFWFADWSILTTPATATENYENLAAGSNTPDHPKITNETGVNVCEDVVQSVSYLFQWNVSRIHSVTAVIQMANITLSANDDVLIEQTFIVAYEHINKTVLDKKMGLKKQKIPVSGHPGYDVGKPLLALTVLGEAQIDDENDYEDEVQLEYDPKIQINTWNTDATNLCAFSSTSPALFGINMTSFCYIQLTRAEFDDCDRLREKVKTGLDRLMPASHLSKVGRIDEQPINAQNAVPILRYEPPNPYLVEPSDNSNNDSNGNAAYDFYNYDTDLSASCYDVSVTVGLDVLYSVTAQTVEAVVTEVTGAMLHYNTSVWRYTSSQPTQRFLLSSSIRYYRKSAKHKSTVARYYLQEGRFHCPSFVTCWDELFYPVLELNLGSDYAYNLAMGLTLFVMVLGVYWLTTPWAV